MKKVIFVVIDGLGDLPCKEFHGKTPLEAAKKPNLDALAKEGQCGYMYPIKEKIAPESDVAVISILGYDPYKYYTGRGPLEAYGAGIKFTPGDLVLRTNFATVEIVKGKKKIIDRRAGRNLTTSEAFELAREINKKVKLQFPFTFTPTVQHRGILVIKGGFSDNISNTDPAYKKVGTFGVAVSKSNEVVDAIPLDEDETSVLSARLVNSFVEQSFSVLNNHSVNIKRKKARQLPANIILTRDAGTSLPDFPKKKEKWALIGSMPLEKAIAKLCGMDILKFNYPKLKIKDVYKVLYDNLSMQIKYSKKYIQRKLRKYDAFYIHIKETDIPGHDGLPFEKKKMIEYIDKEFIGFLRAFCKDAIIIVTADHSTPCSLKMHSADPVPVLVYGKGPGNVKEFSEKACKKGNLGKIYGAELLKKFGR